MKRVVITGIGVISPVGNNAAEFWDSIINGVSGIGPITRFNAENLKTKIAGEVKNFNPEPIIEAKEARRIDLFSQYGICASAEAIEDSGLDLNSIDPFRAGVILGSGIGGIGILEKNIESYLTRGPNKISPFYITGMITDIVAGHISMKYGLRGPNYVTTSACASGSHAIGSAYRSIQLGDADIMIAGGSEGSITPTSMCGFINIQALSRNNDNPTKASCPFDLNRDGFVMGEGAGIVILEELEHARKRGAKIYAEISGAGFTADGYHVTAPHPEGIGAARAMDIAISKSEKNNADVDYINTHGTSTPTGDVSEIKAIKLQFGEKAYDINISSTKSMTGHLLGATGAVEYIATVLTVKNDLIPPTINYETPDPECDLNVTPNEAVAKNVDFAISNSFGFGGHNACLAAKKYTG